MISIPAIMADPNVLDSINIIDESTDICIDQPEIARPKTFRKFGCKICPDASYDEADDFRAHHKSNWHCFNLRASLRKRPALTEVEFEAYAEAVSDNDEETDDEEYDQDQLTIESDDDDSVIFSNRVIFTCGSLKLSIYRSLLFKSKSEYRFTKVTPMILGRFLQDAFASSWAFFLIKSGRVFAAIVQVKTGEITHSKSFKRYTERKKQGGSQLLRDKSGKVAKSAGSQIRRANEQELLKEVATLLKVWTPHLEECQLIFWNRNFFSQMALFQSLEKSDPRLRTIPFQIHKPCKEEVIRSFKLLTTLQKEA